MKTFSKSKFLESNGSNDVSFDKEGELLNGTRITEDGTILRFVDGLLDGDSYNLKGQRIVQPAVEGKGHLEYWRQGFIHRDEKLPAIISEGNTVKEYWENGERLDSSQ